MPSVRALGLHGNPIAEPLTYPGNAVTADSLLVGDWLYQMSPSGMRVWDWPVQIDGGPLVGVSTVDDALRHLGVPLMRERVASLAVGSNASPGQLMQKFGVESSGLVVPITMMKFKGLAVAYSAHVGRAGYIPYAPMAGDSSAPFCVLWLDSAQVARLDETEPNYTPTVVRSPGLMTTGESVGGVVAYRGRWGVLRDGPSGSPLPASGQKDVLQGLLRLPWFRQALGGVLTVEQVVARLANSDDLRTRVREEFSARGLVVEDGLSWE